MSPSAIVSTNFEAVELQTYRAISPCAPLAVLCGLASALALVHPLLWTVPLAGMLVAWVGIKQISADSGYTGRQTLLWGLALSLLFGTMAPVRYVSRHWMLSREAKRLAADWIGLIRQGDVLQAHQWTLSATERASADASLARYYESNATSLASLNEFKRREDLQRFRETLGDDKVRIKTHRVVRDDKGDHVVLKCLTSPPRKGPQKESEISISLRRELTRQTGKAHWQVIVFHADLE